MPEPTQHDPDTNLSSSVSITKYRELEKEKDKTKIVDFIRERFTERYITPLRGDPKLKHGFCTMAICCLMIEALESFRQGWEDTNRQSEKAFCKFFDKNSNLQIFHGFAGDFYKNVRCGILHQAETTNGWRIHRHKDDPIFDPSTKTINATKFHDEIERCLEKYCNDLTDSEWYKSDVWKNLRKKMNSIIKHCG